MMKYKLLIEIILILGISFAANIGYHLWAKHQQQIGYDRRVNEEKIERADKNENILKNKAKVKHEDQNLDRDGLIKLHCSRGWVRKPEQCSAYVRQMRNSLR